MNTQSSQGVVTNKLASQMREQVAQGDTSLFEAERQAKDGGNLKWM